MSKFDRLKINPFSECFHHIDPKIAKSQKPLMVLVLVDLKTYEKSGLLKAR